jgi:hypothetical protein
LVFFTWAALPKKSQLFALLSAVLTAIVFQTSFSRSGRLLLSPTSWPPWVNLLWRDHEPTFFPYEGSICDPVEPEPILTWTDHLGYNSERSGKRRKKARVNASRAFNTLMNPQWATDPPTNESNIDSDIEQIKMTDYPELCESYKFGSTDDELLSSSITSTTTTTTKQEAKDYQYVSKLLHHLNMHA